jgi:PAS domain S-box-containing protein
MQLSEASEYGSALFYCEIPKNLFCCNCLLQETIPVFANSTSGLRIHDILSADDHEKFAQIMEHGFSGKETAPFTHQLRLQTKLYPYSTLTQWEFTFISGDTLTQSHIVGMGYIISCSYNETIEAVRSNEKYHSLFEQASDCIHITDFNGRFIDANTAMLKLFGYTKEELLTMNISSLIDAEQLKRQPIQFERLAEGQHVFSYRTMLHKNGTAIYVEANVKKIGEGMIMAIARDITKRKIIEEELERSEKNLRHVLASSTDNFYMIDTGYRVTL